MKDTRINVTPEMLAHAIEVLDDQLEADTEACPLCSRYLIPCDQHARLSSKLRAIESGLGDQS